MKQKFEKHKRVKDIEDLTRKVQDIETFIKKGYIGEHLVILDYFAKALLAKVPKKLVDPEQMPLSNDSLADSDLSSSKLVELYCLF